jgi:D-alanine-D-alanine ligase-like ATP-grasp enzyme
MKDLIIDSILSCKNLLNKNNRNNCFELFGYDFLIDDDFRVWLIEINENPYLGLSN